MQAYRALFGLLALSCLPVDTRPPPAKITVTVTSSDLTQSGISEALTEDGWSISFERLVVCIGNPRLGGEDSADSCSGYSNPHYTRIIDMAAVSAPQELGIAYALDQCAFSFRIQSPDQDSKIGAGATEQDREFMRTPGSDVYAGVSGISIFAEGSATRGGVAKRFAWEFRQRISYEDCWRPAGDAAVRGFNLGSGDTVTANIEIQGEALFRDHIDPAQAKLRFDAIAAADGDGDGEVTLSELGRIELAQLPAAYSAPDAGAELGTPNECIGPEGDARPLRTLADFLYCGLVPALARFQGDGACRVRTGRERH